MDAYQSLSNRVASMEELLRRSESTVVMVLQRLKALEEYASTSEARHRGGDSARNNELSARLNAAVENQSGKLDALQSAILCQASATQLLEERIQGSVKALEQKVNGEVSGCYQRMQATESSLSAAVHNVESALQSQFSSLKSAEQTLRNDMLSIEQRVNGELVNTRQRVDSLDSSLRSALADVQKSLLDDMKILSETLFGKLQSLSQSTEASIVGLDQKMQKGMNSVGESLAHEIATTRQSMNAQDAAMRDALKGLHDTLAGDITNLLLRIQSAESAHQVSHQQVLAELASQRQVTDTFDTNWRVGINDVNGKVQDGLQALRAQQATTDLSVQQRFSQMTARIDEVYADLRRVIEGFVHPLKIKVDSLEHLSADVSVNKKLVEVVREEQCRLREEFWNFSAAAERSAAQLRTLMENTFKALQSDLLERLKPLTAYRAELHTAITAAFNNLWNEACNVFISQRDFELIQRQIQVLDRAVRNEVTLLAEKGRNLERLAGDKWRLDGVAGSCKSPSAEVGALVPVPVLGELKDMWGELRQLQKNLGMPKEEVISAIKDSRQEMVDVALETVKKSENEFRSILSQIKSGVCKLAPVVCNGGVPVGENNSGNNNNNGSGKKGKKTIVRLRATGDAKPLDAETLHSILKMSRKAQLPQALQLKPPVPSTDLSEAGNLDQGVVPSPSKVFGAAERLPPLAHSVPP